MLDKMVYLFELIKIGLITLRDTDPNQVRYDSLGLALGASLLIISAILFKLLWGRNKFVRPYSGHDLPHKENSGAMVRWLYMFPYILLAMSVEFLILSLANPYLPKTKIEELVESRERLDLIDASPSKGWAFENTNRSAAEMTREAYLNFLKMRRGQNDRASLWYFSAEPTMVEDFIVDDDIYTMAAEDMPYVITDPENVFLPENDKEDKALDIIAPRDRIRMVYNGGGTDLVAALKAVIDHFDIEGDRKIRQRALLIETDMAIDANPEKQLQELKKRNISVYLLHIKPNMVGEMQGNQGRKLVNAELFRKQIEQYGGRFYDVQDRRSLENAYRDINKLERSPSKLVRDLLRVFIYQRPLLAAFVLIFFATGIALVTEPFLGVDP